MDGPVCMSVEERRDPVGAGALVWVLFIKRRTNDVHTGRAAVENSFLLSEQVHDVVCSVKIV